MSPVQSEENIKSNVCKFCNTTKGLGYAWVGDSGYDEYACDNCFEDNFIKARKHGNQTKQSK